MSGLVTMINGMINIYSSLFSQISYHTNKIHTVKNIFNLSETDQYFIVIYKVFKTNTGILQTSFKAVLYTTVVT